MGPDTQKFQIENAKFVKAKQIPSPNFSERPPATLPELIVIHAISLPPMHFGGGFIESFFTNQLDPLVHPYFETIKDLRVSAHLLINRKGEMIQFVDLDKRAFHAGVSEYKGRFQCNDFSIGIELEGGDTLAFEEAQYQTLVGVTAALLSYFPSLTLDGICGHSDIAPGRKTDPGPFFDWDFFKMSLGKNMSK